jgi:ribosomal protein S6--L-glutamate ligase
MKCEILLDTDKPEIIYEDEYMDFVEAIIPRIGASVTFYGASVIQQFEAMGVYTPVSAESLLQSRNKLRTLQILSAKGVAIPKTVFSHYGMNVDDILDHFDHPKVIIKLLEGTQGLGVILAENTKTAESIIDAFIKMKKRFLVQEFIEESSGTDIRVFVVDGEIVASMRRQAPEGEFRSNLHRGG